MTHIANILDPIHEHLDPTVWEDVHSATPKLKERHRKWIVNTIKHVLIEAGYDQLDSWLTLVLTGSLTTYQYSEHSDVDVSLFVNVGNFPEWSRAEMIRVMIEGIDGKKLPGTTHPMQAFVVPPGVTAEMLYKPGLRSGYDLATGTWIVPPEKHRAHDVQKEMNAAYVYALECADKMDRMLKFEPDAAVFYWHMLHRARRRDQQAGKGDYALTNIVYKFLDKKGLLPEIAQVSGEYIAKTGMAVTPEFLAGRFGYHSAPAERHESIMEHGILPWDHHLNPGSRYEGQVQPRPGHVYMTLHDQGPHGYGMYKNHHVQYRVNLGMLDPANINPDEDAMAAGDDKLDSESYGDYAERTGYGDDIPTAEGDIEYIGTLAHRGPIPPEAIEPVYDSRMAKTADSAFHQNVLNQNAGQNLQGLPQNVNVPGIGPMTWHSHGDIQRVANEYNQMAGIPTPHPTDYLRVDPTMAQHIAAEYERMPHDPQNSQVQNAYNALKQETAAQYQHAVKNGYNFEFYPEGQNPYPNSPREAVLDLHHNKHMYVYPTETGFGMGQEEQQDHPMLEQTGESWGGRPVTYNDMMRAVHDFYGHAKEGLGFRADGEDNAYRQHAAMFSPEARKALATETRGQNHWVNYGPHGEHNQQATDDTVYAQNKAGLLPDWAVDPEVHRRTAKTASSQDLYNEILQNGGVTINTLGERPTSGYAFPPYKHTEVTIPVDQFTPEHIDQYMQQHSGELNVPGVYLGAWIYEGNVYLDISEVDDDLDTALQRAAQGSQIAIYDIANGRDIQVPYHVSAAIQNFDIDQNALEQARATLGLEHPVNVTIVGGASGQYMGFDGTQHNINLVGWLKPESANQQLWEELVHAMQYERDPEGWGTEMQNYWQIYDQGHDAYRNHPWELEAEEIASNPPFSLVTAPGVTSKEGNSHGIIQAQDRWALEEALGR